MDMKKIKVALVTGASSGIGQASAELLAGAGYKVYGTSRRGGDGSGRSFEMLSLDVTRDDSVDAAVRRLMQLEGRIDLLVNNAGFGVAPAGAEESSIEQARSIFDTNFFGIVRMTRAVVPHMRRQGEGRIINMGSVLGFLPMPYMALYSATKQCCADSRPPACSTPASAKTCGSKREPAAPGTRKNHESIRPRSIRQGARVAIGRDPDPGTA